MADAQYRQPSPELQRLLDAHRRWDETGGEDGTQLTSHALEANLGTRELEGLDLLGVDFRKASLNHVQFDRCCLVGADFTEASLDRSLTRQSNIEYALYTDASLRAATFRDNSNAESAHFDGADVKLADIPGVTPRRVESDIAAIVLMEP